MSKDAVLEVNDISVRFAAKGGEVRALDRVSLTVRKGEIVAVVGESGCGKTTLARCVLGLQPVAGGSINLLGQKVQGVRKDMSTRVGMVWQDPYASLNPRWKVERSLSEPANLAGRQVDAKALFEKVGLDERFIGRYPHELSGGQRQRVAIGRAIACEPPLVICDEPTSALDLSIRAQILNLLRDLRTETQSAFLYISHDLTTVRFLADRVAVMYLGRIVETGPTEAIFSDPKHPYTKALLDSAPTLDRLGYLPPEVEGEMPDPRTIFKGCRFVSRCLNKSETCSVHDPSATVENERVVFCHHPVNA